MQEFVSKLLEFATIRELLVSEITPFCNSDYQAFEELEVLKFHGICEKRAWIGLCGVALQTVGVDQKHG